MTTWGAYSGSGYGTMRVGIDLTTSDSSPSYGESVTITAKYYAQSQYSWSDSENFAWGFNGSSGSFTWNNTLNSNTILILTKTYTYTVGTSNKTVNANCNISGTYSGATPSVSTSITVPGAAQPPPNPPKLNSVSQDGTNPTTALDASWSYNHTSGANPTNTDFQIATNSAFTTGVQTITGVGSSGNIIIGTGGVGSALTPATTYFVRCRDQSAAGNSGWSNVISQATTSGTPNQPSGVTITDTSAYSGGSFNPHVTAGWVAGAANGTTDNFDVLICGQTSGAPSLTPVSGSTPTATGVGFTNSYQSSVYSTDLTGTTAALVAGNTYYAFVRVTWTGGSGGSPGAWVQCGAPITISGAGGQGDLVDRINAFANLIGQDISALYQGALQDSGWITLSDGFAMPTWLCTAQGASTVGLVMLATAVANSGAVSVSIAPSTLQVNGMGSPSYAVFNPSGTYLGTITSSASVAIGATSIGSLSGVTFTIPSGSFLYPSNIVAVQMLRGFGGYFASSGSFKVTFTGTNGASWTTTAGLWGCNTGGTPNTTGVDGPAFTTNFAQVPMGQITMTPASGQPGWACPQYLNSFSDANAGADYKTRFRLLGKQATVVLATTKAATAGQVSQLPDLLVPKKPVFAVCTTSVTTYNSSCGFNCQNSGNIGINSSSLGNGQYYGSMSYPAG